MEVVVGVSFSFASVVVGGSMSLVLFITVQIQTGRTVHRTDRTDRHRQIRRLCIVDTFRIVRSATTKI